MTPISSSAQSRAAASNQWLTEGHPHPYNTRVMYKGIFFTLHWVSAYVLEINQIVTNMFGRQSRLL